MAAHSERAGVTGSAKGTIAIWKIRLTPRTHSHFRPTFPIRLEWLVGLPHDRHVATNVQEAVVAGSGHWLMEERPAETVALIRGFLDASPEERLTPAEYEFPVRGNPGTGSSGVAGIQTVVLKGDPNQ